MGFPWWGVSKGKKDFYTLVQREEKRGASHARQMRQLSGETPCPRVCILSICAVHVLLQRMCQRPRRVRRLIDACVMPVVSVYALAVVWRCVGLTRWQWQREVGGALDVRGQCGSVVGARWQ